MNKKAKKMKENSALMYIWCALVLLFLVVPVLIIIPMSFGGSGIMEFPPKSLSLRWYHEIISNDDWLTGLFNSIRISVGTMLFSCVLGILAAIGIKNAHMKGGGIINIICILPMMLPSVIVAVAMYLVYGKWGLVGTVSGIIAAHTCLAIPMVITLMISALSGVDGRFYDAARSLGASHFTANIQVVLPLVKPAIFSSMLFSFITSFDESVISLFITNRNTITLPKMIFNSLKYEISPVISAISTILIGITILVFFANTVIKLRTQK